MKLDLPDYYDENLTALWECLTGFNHLPLSLVWENFDESKGHTQRKFYSFLKKHKKN
ncbi:barstar family protein [Rossellomorea aquimaris]|uniref:barstar family protein n=1 Tax=Rossellomorea aquimaris TaxID=189382 RepID=UPI003CF29244